MCGAVIVMTPFESAVRGSLEGSRDGRTHVHYRNDLGDPATPLCGTQLATRGGTREYRASVAQWKADMAAKRPKQAKLVTNPRLREYVEQRLSGTISRPDGTVVVGPQPPRFTGRNKPHRKDRAWVLGWSPEQISNRLKIDFPDDESMRISHEALYQALFIEARGALERELVWCLRTGKALRVPRERSRRKTWWADPVF